MDLIKEDEKMVEITLRTIGPSPCSRLTLPSTLKVKELRRLIAGTTHLPLENMTLVSHGIVLHDCTHGEESLVQLHEGETVTVAMKPKPPVKHIQDSFDDDDGEDLKFQLPESTSGWKRRLFFTLRDTFKLPDMLLMAIFSLRTKTWIAILIWFILAPVAHKLDIGPLYILGTGFLIIFYNLGHRQPGDVRSPRQGHSTWAVLRTHFPIGESSPTLLGSLNDVMQKTATKFSTHSAGEDALWRLMDTFNTLAYLVLV